jgi:hypothetical protein
MKPSRSAAALRFFLAASIACACCLASPARAFLIPTAQPGVAVIEYYNAGLRHYFLTSHADEMAAIDAGSAGPGWTRTGWSFTAYPADSPEPGSYCPTDGCGVPVSRFYSFFSNSHFYTADAGEAAGIGCSSAKSSASAFPTPRADAPRGSCPWIASTTTASRSTTAIIAS